MRDTKSVGHSGVVLTFLFDSGHVDGPEGRPGGVAGLKELSAQAAGNASQRGRAQVEGRPGLHDGAR